MLKKNNETEAVKPFKPIMNKELFAEGVKDRFSFDMTDDDYHAVTFLLEHDAANLILEAHGLVMRGSNRRDLIVMIRDYKSSDGFGK